MVTGGGGVAPWCYEVIFAMSSLMLRGPLRNEAIVCFVLSGHLSCEVTGSTNLMCIEATAWCFEVTCSMR
jgi:hypothetical protein